MPGGVGGAVAEEQTLAGKIERPCRSTQRPVHSQSAAFGGGRLWALDRRIRGVRDCISLDMSGEGRLEQGVYRTWDLSTLSLTFRGSEGEQRSQAVE